MKISIITPAKNSAKYIESCIQSVMNQAEHEHIFMDGSSTDGTLAIIKDYAMRYPDKVKYFNSIDKSAGEAWVKGMRLSTGDILGWLGADDTLEPDALFHVLNWFKSHSEEFFVFGGINYIDEKGCVIKTPHIKDFDLNEAVNNYCSIPCTSAFYRREVVEKIDTEIIAQSDSELEWWLNVAKSYKLNRMESVLSNFRVYPEKPRRNGVYTYAKTVYDINKRHGMKPLSKCALRYYTACLSRPIELILNPIFNRIVYGE